MNSDSTGALTIDGIGLRWTSSNLLMISDDLAINSALLYRFKNCSTSCNNDSIISVSWNLYYFVLFVLLISHHNTDLSQMISLFHQCKTFRFQLGFQFGYHQFDCISDFSYTLIFCLLNQINVLLLGSRINPLT